MENSGQTLKNSFLLMKKIQLFQEITKKVNCFPHSSFFIKEPNDIE